MATLTKRTVIRGTSDIFNITIKDEDGVAVNLTGWTVWFTVRKTVPTTSITSDTDAIISKTVTTFTEVGVVPINITPAETDIDPGVYIYDIQYKKADGTIKSSETYNYVIKADVTRDS